jgi:hypothetical protein
MDTDKQTLDRIFIPVFEALADGEVIDIVGLNWNFDFRQKSGALTKGELEYVINYQIQQNNIEVISDTEFKKGKSSIPQKIYETSQAIVDKAATDYSKQFWEKFNAIKNT